MSEAKPILEDKREIQSLHFEDGASYTVGVDFQKIEAYGEPAQYCNVPFFAVHKNDEIFARVPAGQVVVVYKSENCRE